MQTAAPHVSCEKIPEVFICREVETPAPTLAAAQLPSSMGTRIGGSHPFSMDINAFSNSRFISSLMGSLKNTSLKSCARISVGKPPRVSAAQ